MQIPEGVTRRKQTFAIDNPQEVYSEIRDLLERRMGFDEVTETKYFNDVDEGVIRSKIETTEFYDHKTKEELEINLYINQKDRELDVEVKGKLITFYPTDGGIKDSLWYYAYTAIYEKFLYGQVRAEYEPAVKEKVETLFSRIRDNVEVQNNANLQ